MIKKKAFNKDKYKESVFYKRLALQTLEIGLAMNTVMALGYFIYVFPKQYFQYKASVADDAFGDNAVTVTLFYAKTFFLHSCPFFVMLTSIFISEIIFMETDWWLIVMISFVYTVVNYGVCTWKGIDEIYFMDWAVVS